MGTDAVDAALVHDDDAVRLLNGGDPLRHNDLGGLRQVVCQRLPDHGVSLGIHGAGGIVQNQDLGLLQQGPGNT